MLQDTVVLHLYFSVLNIKVILSLSSNFFVNFFALSGNGCETFWDTDPVTDSCYQFNFQATLSWSEARISCRQQGADLLSITKLHEQTYINGNVQRFTAVWNILDSLMQLYKVKPYLYSSMPLHFYAVIHNITIDHSGKVKSIRIWVFWEILGVSCTSVRCAFTFSTPQSVTIKTLQFWWHVIDWPLVQGVPHFSPRDS